MAHILKQLLRRAFDRTHRKDPSRVHRYSVGKSPVSIGRYTYRIEGMTVRQWGEGAGLSIGSFCSQKWPDEFEQVR